MKNQNTSFPVPPNSVYVWRGYKNDEKTYEDFYSFLGSVFVPACALLQPPVGLRAYIPTLVPQRNKHMAIPDQTALMFWATPQSHNLANETVAVRAYQHLHGALYDMTRSHTPEVPVTLPSEKEKIVADQPYYLLEHAADWMFGQIIHVIGSRPSSLSVTEFLQANHTWALEFQKNIPANVDAALLSCAEDYTVLWIHMDSNNTEVEQYIHALDRYVHVHMVIQPEPLTIEADLWNNWGGIDYSENKNASLNIQLNRPVHTKPKKPGILNNS